jgi:dephospho-CoA kinase
MIIGITGLCGSGKGAVSEILIEKGFKKLGHSGVISDELIKRGIAVTRENQVNLANAMRKKFGGNYWAKRLIEGMDPKENYVVEGFRNVAEVDEFRKLNDFFLIGVAAGSKRRYKWLIQRGREGDPTNYDDFVKNERRDFFQHDKPEGQQNAICFSMADYFISNEGTYDELRDEIEKMIKNINGLGH